MTFLGVRAATALAAAALALTGCGSTGGGQAGGPAEREGAGARGLPLGATSLAPEVRGVRLLVVGDSWARNLGVGVADADKDRRNVVVNAGMGGCGLMQPDRVRREGRLVPAPATCNTWPQRWPDLVAKYRPSAVLLEVGYWDGQDSQVMPGDHDVSSITDASFRRRFDAQFERAVRLLTAGGARVYVPTVIDNEGVTRANSDAMNEAVRAAVRRDPRTRLLDVHGQLCTASKACPARIAGLQVYDATGHPTGPAHDRLGAWILNSIYADQHERRM